MYEFFPNDNPAWGKYFSKTIWARHANYATGEHGAHPELVGDEVGQRDYTLNTTLRDF
jgi:hypothetical protein